MSISLIKKQDNKQSNQKEFQKLLLTKQSYIVNITDYLPLKNETDYNDIKVGFKTIFISYMQDTNGIVFLKEILKKLLCLKNVSFKDFTRQEIIEYIEISTNDILQDLNY